MNHPLNPTRLYALDGDDEDVGYWSKGHHEEAAMRAAVLAAYPEGDRHDCAADPAACTYFKGWWRKVPTQDGSRLIGAAPESRGAFRVTALLTSNAEI